MRDQKLHAAVARSRFWSKNGQNTSVSEHFGRWVVEKVRAAVARSTCRSQNTYNTPCSDQFWKLRCLKTPRSCGEKRVWKSKVLKTLKTDGLGSLFWDPGAVLRSRGNGFRRGTFEGMCQDAFRVAGAVQETYSADMLRGQGADFLRGAAFWILGSSGLLRWFCVTGAALRMIWLHFFVAGAVL